MTDELKMKVARAIAKANGLDFDEVCGVHADPDEGYCDSSTCIAACFEDHDADWARNYYCHEAQAAIEALDLPALIARTKADALREAARKGYETCAKTRHVMLGDAVAKAILALIPETNDD